MVLPEHSIQIFKLLSIGIQRRRGRRLGQRVAMAKTTCIAIVLALVVGSVCAQAPPPGDCGAAYGILSPCFTYVSGPDATPSQQCCQGLAMLNMQNPDCLCQAVSQLRASPTVNATKALGLPSQCNVNVDTGRCPAFSLPPPPGGLPPTQAPPMTPGPSTGATPPIMPPVGTNPPMSSPPAQTPEGPVSSPPSTTPSSSPTPSSLPPSTIRAPGAGPGSTTPTAPAGPAAAPRENAASALRVSWIVCCAAALTMLRLL